MLLTASHWLLSLFDRGKALAVTPDGLRCQSREQKEWHGCRSNKGVQGKEKYFFEAIVTDEGLCRVGWATSQVIISTFHWPLKNTCTKCYNYRIYGVGFVGLGNR